MCRSCFISYVYNAQESHLRAVYMCARSSFGISVQRQQMALTYVICNVCIHIRNCQLHTGVHNVEVPQLISQYATLPSHIKTDIYTPRRLGTIV